MILVAAPVCLGLETNVPALERIPYPNNLRRICPYSALQRAGMNSMRYADSRLLSVPCSRTIIAMLLASLKNVLMTWTDLSSPYLALETLDYFPGVKALGEIQALAPKPALE